MRRYRFYKGIEAWLQRNAKGPVCLIIANARVVYDPESYPHWWGVEVWEGAHVSLIGGRS